MLAATTPKQRAAGRQRQGQADSHSLTHISLYKTHLYLISSPPLPFSFSLQNRQVGGGGRQQQKAWHGGGKKQNTSQEEVGGGTCGQQAADSKEEGQATPQKLPPPSLSLISSPPLSSDRRTLLLTHLSLINCLSQASCLCTSFTWRQKQAGKQQGLGCSLKLYLCSLTLLSPPLFFSSLLFASLCLTLLLSALLTLHLTHLLSWAGRVKTGCVTWAWAQDRQQPNSLEAGQADRWSATILLPFSAFSPPRYIFKIFEQHIHPFYWSDRTVEHRQTVAADQQLTDTGSGLQPGLAFALTPASCSCLSCNPSLPCPKQPGHGVVPVVHWCWSVTDMVFLTFLTLTCPFLTFPYAFAIFRLFHSLFHSYRIRSGEVGRRWEEVGEFGWDDQTDPL